MPIHITNQISGVIVSSPSVILHGTSTIESGIIQVLHPKFPAQNFEVNKGIFKLLVHLEPGANFMLFTHHDGKFVNGRPEFNASPRFQPEELKFKLVYEKMVSNPAVHLFLLKAKDSRGKFDTMPYKLSREGNDVAAAVRKLRMGGRMMQAFTMEQMFRNGLGNRTFNFAEETTNDTLSGQEHGRVARQTIKVHVLTIDKTVSEIRDKNVAQQNPHASDSGALFSWAIEAVRKSEAYKKRDETFSHFWAACMYLDAHWSQSKQLIVGHAALGGGAGDVQMAIFGSQGLWSWPNCYEELTMAFSDCTTTDTAYVANDCNECGSAWEALNISMGAFLHEIGHSLGCPHHEDGIMCRAYQTWNRSFMTREFPCIRTGTHRIVSPITAAEECGWSRSDLINFVYHPCFRLPIDLPNEYREHDAWRNEYPIVVDAVDGGVRVTSESGIYLVRIDARECAHGHVEYLPTQHGGPGPQKEVLLTFKDLQRRIREGVRNDKISVRIFALGEKEYEIGDLKQICFPPKKKFRGDHGSFEGFQTHTLGREDGHMKFTEIALKTVVAIRIYYGDALDGISFRLSNGHTKHVGSTSNKFEDFSFERGEYLTQLGFRCGAWMDAVQLTTNSAKYPMIGNAEGGHYDEIRAPKGYELVGFMAWTGGWLNGIAGVYR